jgi:aryl carrier-like protein
MDDDLREMLARIDERVKALDVRVNRLENKLDSVHSFLLRRSNGWRERGVVVVLISIIVGLVEVIKRLMGLV